MRSRQSYWLLFLVLIISFTPSLIYAESFMDSLSLGFEKEIGYQTYQETIATKQVVKLSQRDQDHLNSLFFRLVNQSGRRKEIKYSLTVIKDDTVNAFALPGGYVFVNTGLLTFSKNDGELAGVLGHEIAHVDRRHSMQTITRQVGMSLLLQMVLSRGKDHEKQIGQMGAVAINLAQLGYSRDAEYQADSYGVRFMRGAGYNKAELLNFWRRMEDSSGGGKNPAFLQMFSTHPPTGDRIKRIEAM